MMMKRKLLLFMLLTTVFIALATPLAFAGEPQYARLSVDPSTGVIEHPTYTINIKISEVTNLWAVSFQLDFNTPDDCLDFESVEAGNLMAGAEVGWKETATYLRVLVNMPFPTTVDGSGSVAKITFNLKETAEAGMISQLFLPPDEASAAAILPDGTPQDIVITGTDSGSVEVGLLITTLTISVPSTATVEKQITISSTLKDGAGNLIPSQTIDYNSSVGTQSQKIGSAPTDANGVSSISYTPTDVGTFNITALYSGSPKYAGSNDTAPTTVNPMTTTLSLDVPLSIKVQDTVDLVATLKKDGTPLGSSTVNYYIDSTGIGSAVTDASGIASIKCKFNSTGMYEIKAEYDGTAKYTPSSDTVTRTVASVRTILTIDVTPKVVKADEPITMTATLEDETGNPLEGLTIDYYVDSQKIGSDDTDATGVASIVHRPPAAGEFQVEAIYSGTPMYTASSDTDTIVVLHIETTLTISVPTTATVEKPVTISAALEDEYENLIESETIDFYIRRVGDTGWTPIESDETDASGIASISYTPTDAGTFQIKVVYNGSEKYAESSDTAMITINLMATSLDLNVPTSAKVEDTIALVATLKDENRNPIAGSTVDYYIYSGAGWNPIGFAVTVTGGIASMDYTPTDAGTFRIKAEYNGSLKHAESSAEATLTVSQVETTLTINVPSTTTVGTSITISTTLKDEDGNRMHGCTVYYYVSKGGGWTEIGSTVTNVFGVTSMNYTPSEAGTFRLKAVYEGTQKYAESSKEATLEVSAEEVEEEEEGHPLSFLLDEKLTILDILFWAFVIVSFSTLVFVYIWKKIK